jgi:hypothetical protein
MAGHTVSRICTGMVEHSIGPRVGRVAQGALPGEMVRRAVGSMARQAVDCVGTGMVKVVRQVRWCGTRALPVKWLAGSWKYGRRDSLWPALHIEGGVRPAAGIVTLRALSSEMICRPVGDMAGLAIDRAGGGVVEGRRQPGSSIVA